MKSRGAIFFATIGWLVLALVIWVGGVVLTTFWPDSEKRKMEKIKSYMRNLESDVVRIELAGKNSDTPMRTCVVSFIGSRRAMASNYKIS